MKIKTVSIIGLGALGILFGNHLLKQMPQEDLRIITDKERAARYCRDKVYSNGELCTFNYMLPDTVCEPADLVIFAVKHNGLKDAIQAVHNQVGKHTVILSTLNGVTSEAEIGQVYGMDKIVYCVAQGMDGVKAGNQLTYHNMGMLCIGDCDSGADSENVRAVAEFFDRTHLPYEIVDDMYRKLWSKFMLNVGVNQAVAVNGRCYGDVQREGHAREVMVSAMREAVVIAQKEGIDLNEADVQYWLEVVGKLSPNGKPSMRQDVEARRFSEVSLFSGTVLELGKKHGVPTPVNRVLYDRIAAIESTYDK